MSSSGDGSPIRMMPPTSGPGLQVEALLYAHNESIFVRFPDVKPPGGVLLLEKVLDLYAVPLLWLSAPTNRADLDTMSHLDLFSIPSHHMLFQLNLLRVCCGRYLASGACLCPGLMNKGDQTLFGIQKLPEQ